MTQTKRGGKRENAGRKPRVDGRTWRSVRVPLTDAEFLLVKTLTPDDRREALLGLAVYYEDILKAKDRPERPPLYERVLIKAKRPRPPLKRR